VQVPVSQEPLTAHFISLTFVQPRVQGGVRCHPRSCRERSRWRCDSRRSESGKRRKEKLPFSVTTTTNTFRLQ
jgi:hypothetical protein